MELTVIGTVEHPNVIVSRCCMGGDDLSSQRVGTLCTLKATEGTVK